MLVVCLLISSACSSPPTQSPATAAAGTPTPSRSARLHKLVGLVFAQDSEAVSYLVAEDGQAVREHGQVRTGVASSARLDFSDGSIVRMGQSSVFVVDQLGGTDRDPVTRLKFGVGLLWVSLTGGQMLLQTPLGLARVRGSYAEIHYQPGAYSTSIQDDELTISCIEGTCTFDTGTGIITLGNLQQLVVSHGGQTITGPTDLDASYVREFVTNSPESTGVVPSLTAAAQSPTAPSATPSPMDTPGPPGTAAPTNTPTPADTPTVRATDTPLPGDTPQPSPTRTRRPPVIVPTAPPSDTPGPTDTPLPTATDTRTPPPPPHPPPPTATQLPVATHTPAPPPTATNRPPPTETASRRPPPTKTASPGP